ncbi:transcription factor IBH1-like [Quillaja saponaria]|uniref:Transcription factor IBH1-like n=1 Tax=Quillaja saponaria TaxID=32244 RepID=A0AAD7PIZ5_QUISA|nr:transcription factor IBH1-like [Quillaja saponaria]
MTSKSVTKAKANCCRARFTTKFVRELLKIRNSRLSCLGSVEEIRKCSLRIKKAAYSSMAHAVGSRRAWSKAVLFKLRNRARCQGLMKTNSSIYLAAKKKVSNKRRKVVIGDGEVSQVNKLRQLVPGGKSMDICRLLEETTHYVKCLSVQVKVMKSFVDHFSKNDGTHI